MLPLENIKVLDLTRLLPGEYCSMMLGDFGADIIKIEDTIRGDYARWIDPLFTNSMIDDTISAYFASLNRNKKSIKLNLKTREGVEIFLRLATSADVILESFRPGVMDRLGLGYDTVKKINPKIVYCAISGFGQTGPYKKAAGHDINYLAISGVLGMQGIKMGPPVLSGIQIADLSGAIMAVPGILLALLSRNRSGKGQYVDIAMMDGAVSFLAMHAGNFWGDGKEPKRGEENLNGGYACYNVYETKDGQYLALGALEKKFWVQFLEAVGRQDLADDHLADVNRQAEMIEELKAVFLKKSSHEWIETFRNIDACISPVNNFPQAFVDPQIRERKMVERFTYKNKTGAQMSIMQLGIPVKLSETPGTMRLGPPQYGEHTKEILLEHGYSNKEVESFFATGVC